MHNAKFYLSRDAVHKDNHPCLASKTIPNWLKKAKPYLPSNPDDPGDVLLPTAHAKRCVPLIEATSLGYTVLAPEELIISLEYDRPFIRTPRFGYFLGDAPDDAAPISHHDPRQAGTFFDAYTDKSAERWVFKYANHWILEAEKGYDLLFTPLLNGDYSDIQFFSGLVNTNDGHFVETNMPFYIKPGAKTVTIKEGQPLYQIIPIKRERYGLKVYRELNQKIKERIKDSNIKYVSSSENVYRDFHWNRAGKSAKKPWYQWFKRG